MKAGLESMLQSIKEKKSMAGLSMAPFPTSSSATTVAAAPPSASMIGPAAVSTYASAAANALNNNNISVGSISAANASMGAGNIMTLGGPGVQALTGGGPSTLSHAAGSLVLKNVQSLAYCYAIDCKSSYEELNRIMRVSYSFSIYL